MTKQEFLALAADKYESLQKLNDNLFRRTLFK